MNTSHQTVFGFLYIKANVMSPFDVMFPPTGPEDLAYSKIKNYKTYYCEPLAGEASPGIEPEPEAAGHYSIAEVK